MTTEPQVNDRNIDWLKNEIKIAEKLHKKILSDLDPEDEDYDFLRGLPEPWDFLDDGENLKSKWKSYVESSINALKEKYPGQVEKYIAYTHAKELHEHNPRDYPKPPKQKYAREFKDSLNAIRTFFDCREMKYMDMLCTIYDVITKEFPELLEDEPESESESKVKTI